jgi:hypothetical protein
MKKLHLLSIVALALALTGSFALANQDPGTAAQDPRTSAQDLRTPMTGAPALAPVESQVVTTVPAPPADEADADVDSSAIDDDVNVDLNADGDDDLDVTSEGIQIGHEADVQTEAGADMDADADALPRTASPLALLALFGAGGIGSAAGLRWARRK